MKLVHAIALTALLTTAACSDPHDLKLPTDVKELGNDEKLKAAAQKLPEEERELLAGYLARQAIAQAFGAGGGPIKTVGEAIAAQRTFLADQKAKEAEAKALAARVEAERATARKAMEDVLTVAVTRKAYVPSDFMNHRPTDYVECSIALQNKSPKDIKGVKGEVLFSDMFGDKIREISLSMDDEIAAGKTLVWEGTLDHNPFMAGHEKLKNTPLDKMKVTWIPHVILFADGSSLKLPSGG